MRRAAWVPLLDGAEASLARTVARGIGDALRPRLSAASWPTTDAFLALLYAELSTDGDAEDDALAVHLVERAMERAAEVDLGTGLFTGFPGVATAVSLLSGRVLEPPASGDDDPCDGADEAIEAILGVEPFPADVAYDLVNGLVGLGVCALERLHRPRARRCLLAVVARLEQLALRQVEGVAWVSPPSPAGLSRPPKPPGTLDLGMAHGLAGVIALLGRCCARGVREARPLLHEAVSFLLSQERSSGGSCFPLTLVPGVDVGAWRAAWCYGDPGVALALLLAARGAGEPGWEVVARRVARAAAARPRDACGVADAALCHGAAGLGHLFNRLYQATGDLDLGAAARAWFGEALARRADGAGIAGYRSHDPAPGATDPWEDDASLLSGAPGIALALLSATASEEPVWDRVLLMSPIGP